MPLYDSMTIWLCSAILVKSSFIRVFTFPIILLLHSSIPLFFHSSSSFLLIYYSTLFFYSIIHLSGWRWNLVYAYFRPSSHCRTASHHLSCQRARPLLCDGRFSQALAISSIRNAFLRPPTLDEITRAVACDPWGGHILWGMCLRFINKCAFKEWI